MNEPERRKTKENEKINLSVITFVKSQLLRDVGANPHKEDLLMYIYVANSLAWRALSGTPF